MRRSKARRAAAHGARDPRRVDLLDGEIGTEATSDPITLQSVYDGTTCIGFLLPRGRQGVEAFDCNTRSLGLYPDLKSAADAVSRIAGGEA